MQRTSDVNIAMNFIFVSPLVYVNFVFYILADVFRIYSPEKNPPKNFFTFFYNEQHPSLQQPTSTGLEIFVFSNSKKSLNSCFV